MKDEHDKQTRDLLSGEALRKTAAERQARLIERRAQEGWKRKTIWVHEPSRQAGYAAGEGGDPCEPAQAGAEDKVSWLIGWEAATKD